MSVKAISWAFTQQVKPSMKVLLLALADHADDEGYCFPSVPTLASKSTLSVRTVQRTIERLIDDGFVQRTNRFDESGRQTSSAYRLRMSIDVHEGPDEGDKMTPGGCQNDTGEGDTVVTGEGDTVDTLITLNHQKEPPEGKDAIGLTDEQMFNEWWSLVIKKDDKAKARKAFSKALKVASFDTILDGQIAQNAYWEREGTPRRFMRGPAVWLNNESWENQSITFDSESDDPLDTLLAEVGDFT